MNKRKYKIVRLYIIALLCIVFFFFLENSNIISELVEKSNKFRYGSFGTFLLTGLFKYGLLVVGISIIIIMSFMLIRERTKTS
ncbi:hypothetical protein SAMN05216261_2319 [Algibacter luteus]|uniref:Uncharacterized protein n=1 Tax=Algibacter luteus TaxID=1178825 RepID=A0A1M6FCH2_9FLAO|nr:hypothetical protein [Algibacter luteus]SHI95438.1 hypothetical protein SAMN05216261_2319 [Algibacter luteus]